MKNDFSFSAEELNQLEQTKILGGASGEDVINNGCTINDVAGCGCSFNKGEEGEDMGGGTILDDEEVPL